MHTSQQFIEITIIYHQYQYLVQFLWMNSVLYKQKLKQTTLATRVICNYSFNTMD